MNNSVGFPKKQSSTLQDLSKLLKKSKKTKVLTNAPIPQDVSKSMTPEKLKTLNQDVFQKQSPLTKAFPKAPDVRLSESGGGSN